jgi:hypothetical protein
LEQVSICDRHRPPTAARSSWRRSASSAPPCPHRPVLPAALPAARQEPARSSPAGHGGSPGGVRRHILHPQSVARLVPPPSELAAAAISSRRPPVVGGGDGNFVVISGKMRGNLVLVGACRGRSRGELQISAPCAGFGSRECKNRGLLARSRFSRAFGRAPPFVRGAERLGALPNSVV